MSVSQRLHFLSIQLPGKRSACGWGVGGRQTPLASSLSEARQEVCDSHGGGGPVALLHAAVLAEGHVEALVNKRLVGIVVVGQQGLPELALIHKGPLQHRKPGMKGRREREEREQREEVSRHRGGRRTSATARARPTSARPLTLAQGSPSKHAPGETGGGGMSPQGETQILQCTPLHPSTA